MKLTHATDAAALAGGADDDDASGAPGMLDARLDA